MSPSKSEKASKQVESEQAQPDLSEEQLKEVFKRTSLFSVHSTSAPAVETPEDVDALIDLDLELLEEYPGEFG